MRAILISTLLVIAISLAGCASTNQVKSIGQLKQISGQKPSIIVMPIDVELSILTASGLQEPQAEWTQNANQFIWESLNQELARRDTKLVPYEAADPDSDPKLAQIERLHEAVGYAALVHHVGQAKLPSKHGQFDWTLGNDVKDLKKATGADYAMFVFIRDSYSSAGRVALQIGAAILGVGVHGGYQIGFASMVDLDTGEIAWFNFLSSGTGDLRKQETANKTVAALLKGLPEA